MKRRREVSVFGMSFLDVMFCGFGSVVLLVMLINGKQVTTRREVHEDLRAEVTRLEREVVASERLLAEIRNSLDATERETVEAAGRSRRVLDEIEKTEAELAELDAETLARREHVNALKSDLSTLDADQRRLNAEIERASDRGESVRKFLGDGDRQYVTGLRVGGERVLVLVDASASMLDESIVNVVRRRNMGDDAKRRAPKWQRTLATVEWLVANLPQESRFQIYAFDVQARALLTGSEGKWLSTGDANSLDRAVAALREVVPGNGTSLVHAFEVIGALSPAPDNVILLTDGLPTQGASRPSGTTVSPVERLRHFERALAAIPSGVPVNSILFPMEGDPLAASAFWKLAAVTRGSFLTPAKDWP